MHPSQPQSTRSSSANRPSSYLDDADIGFQPRPPSFASQAPDLSSHLPPGSSYNPAPSYDRPPQGSPPPVDPHYNPVESSSSYEQQQHDYNNQQQYGARPESVYSSALGPNDSASAVGDRAYGNINGGGEQERLSYIDERGEYYSGYADGGRGLGDDEEDGGQRRGLVGSAATMSGGWGDEEGGNGQGQKKMHDMDYSDSQPTLLQGRSNPSQAKTLTVWGKIQRSLAVGAGKETKEQRIERKKRGIGRQVRPWASWILSVAMVCALIFELVRNHQLTGSVIAIKPTFNWMIGPSSATLVNVGARFVPCMKNVPDAPLTTLVGCFNETRTSIPESEACTIADWCGLKTTDAPRQRYRFIVPVFLHAGIVHLALNLLVLNTAGAQVEKEMGSFFYLLIFFSGALFGFELGGNFALPGVPSVGASGGIFAVNAVTLVDLLEHWQFEPRPKLKLGLLILELLMMIGLGYIPLLIDNFAHLGGLLIGLLLGVIIYPCISTTKRHRTIVWIIRGVAFVGLVLALVFVSINFFAVDSSDACEWCRYLSCLPVKQTNYCKGTGLPTATESTSTTKRSLFEF